MTERIDLGKSWIIHIALFIFGTLSILTKTMDIGPALILLVSFTAFLERFNTKLDNDDKRIIAVLLLYFTVGIFDTLLRWQSISNMDLFIRYAIGAWLTYYLAQRKLHVWVLWVSFAIGAIAVGIYALYAKFSLGMLRVDIKHFNAIRFGNYSLVFGLFCFAGIFWANRLRYKKLMISIMLFAGVMGILASILSGTRSGWISYPMVFITMVVFFYDHFPKKYVITAATLCIALLVGLIAMPQTNVQGRFKNAIHDIEMYQKGNSSTSVGLRFEMWKSGLDAFIKKPIFGWGEEAFRQHQIELTQEKGLNKLITTFAHTHNQYIEELAKRGVIGLISLLLLFIIPLRLFLKRMRSSSDTVRALALAGVISIICAIDFNLTQAMQRVNSGVMFFVFNLVFIWSAMRHEERSLKQIQPT